MNEEHFYGTVVYRIVSRKQGCLGTGRRESEVSSRFDGLPYASELSTLQNTCILYANTIDNTIVNLYNDDRK